MKKISIIKACLLGAIILSGSAAFGEAPAAPALPQSNGLHAVMLGHLDMRSAKIWVALKEGSAASLECFEGEAKTPIFVKRLKAADEPLYTAIEIGFLKPNTEYRYVFTRGADDDAIRGSFTTLEDYPERKIPPDFEVAFLGECYDNEKLLDPPFRTPGGDYEIFSTILSSKPRAAVWVGGATVLRNADLGARAGYFARYANARNQKEVQALLRGIPNYGVMAISSFGAADADKGWALKNDALDAFKTFWANPNYGASNLEGAATHFRVNDAEFFVLDDCTYRNNLDYLTERNARLGPEQILWLKRALTASKATFKIIVVNSSLANPVETPDNLAIAKAERTEVLDFLTTCKISGVIVVSANKPYSELTKLVRAGAYDLYDVSVGATTGRTAKEANQLNYFKVPGSTFFQRTFVKMVFDGPENDRRATISICDAKGKILFKQPISHSSLK